MKTTYELNKVQFLNNKEKYDFSNHFEREEFLFFLQMLLLRLVHVMLIVYANFSALPIAMRIDAGEHPSSSEIIVLIIDAFSIIYAWIALIFILSREDLYHLKTGLKYPMMDIKWTRNLGLAKVIEKNGDEVTLSLKDGTEFVIKDESLSQASKDTFKVSCQEYVDSKKWLPISKYFVRYRFSLK